MDIDDKIILKIFMLNLQGNQYKLMMTKYLGKFCEALYQDQYKELFDDVHNHLKMKVPWKSCPYPKGSNEFKDFLFQINEDSLPSKIPGSEKWQLQMRYYKAKKMLGGFNVFATVK